MNQDPDFTVKSFKYLAIAMLCAASIGCGIGMLTSNNTKSSPAQPVNEPCPHLRLAGIEGEFIFIPDKPTADKLQSLNWTTKSITNMGFVK